MTAPTLRPKTTDDLTPYRTMGLPMLGILALIAIAGVIATFGLHYMLAA